MSLVRRPAGDRLVLSPMEPLIARVPSIDDAGIRALVRGHTSARRLGVTWENPKREKV